jgi:hypothetical protein
MHAFVDLLHEFHHQRKVGRKKMNEGLERGHRLDLKVVVGFRGYEAERETATCSRLVIAH